jgi:hypothetical protein
MPTFVAKSNLPRDPFRWSLSDSNEAPGSDGCYSSRQLLSACFGSLHKARLEQIEQETKHTGLKNGILRGEFLDRRALESVFGQVATLMKQVIENSPLDRSEKDDLLRALASVPVGIADVAAAGRRAGNGSGDHSEGTKPRKKPGRKSKRPAESAAVSLISSLKPLSL